jgi:UDP-N-acetyl-D-mannosaminuronic acid dehydrogenase
MFDVCVIGMGRVGLPLALSLEECGLSVSGVDFNYQALRDSFKNGKMPFFEPEYDDLVKKSKIEIFEANNYPESKAYIITVGTPLKQHIETDLSYVKNVVESLFNKIDMTEKLLILRSTLSPNTTTYLKNWINSKTKYVVGENVFLAMCPERLAEGAAHKELLELPQIVGAEDAISADKARDIFKVFGVKLFDVSYIEAELAKLFSNGYRYINFSIPNYFAYIAEQYGVDVFKLFNAMNTDYSRNNGLKSPGLSAGTCLRKDWGFLNEAFPQSDLFLQAYKINEFYPIEPIRVLGNELNNKVVGVLGYTMKYDTDDTRDSLVPKIIRQVERFVPKQILIHEPNLPIGFFDDNKMNEMSFENIELDKVIAESEIILLTINHTVFKKLKKENFIGKIVVDYWGMLGEQRINRWNQLIG